jgi:hypothetical protein
VYSQRIWTNHIQKKTSHRIMNKIDNGGLAFPQPMAVMPTTGEMHCAFEKHPDFAGMTLRDWFAGMALQGLLAQPLDVGCNYVPRLCAQSAFDMADAMLAARKEGA